MADRNRRAGLIQLYIDGRLHDAKGSWSYHLGPVTREGIAGADRVHGYKEQVSLPMIEGAITDAADLSLSQLQALTDTTVQLVLGNGKTIVLRNAWFAGDGNGTTEEGEVAVRFEGLSAEELSA